LSIGRRHARSSGAKSRRLDYVRGGTHRPRPVERNHEEATVVEHVNRRHAC
jgi:hypothetical protein